MTATIPTADGEINGYNLRGTQKANARIYFGNGIRVTRREHMMTAAFSLLLMESSVRVGNRTMGLIRGLVWDVAPCMLDYTDDVMA